jgi:hypothetical protein
LSAEPAAPDGLIRLRETAVTLHIDSRRDRAIAEEVVTAADRLDESKTQKETSKLFESDVCVTSTP